MKHKCPSPRIGKKPRGNIGRWLYAAFLTATLSASLCQPASAATVWEKANEIMRDVYTQILGISTIAAIVTVRRELEHEQDPRCRVLQEDYLKLIRQLGSREAITRRFFLVFEYEPLPGTKRGHEEEDAIASLQTAARTAANYLRQCGNEVISPENEDDATVEILYNILCRRASSEPFYQRVKSVLADYMASGRDINAIPVNEFYAPDSIDLMVSCGRR